MKPPILILIVIFLSGGLNAQTNVWQPSSGHTQVSIWPGEAPDAQPMPGPEHCSMFTNLIAGKPCVRVDNVSQPTMTVYSPKGTNNGAAIIVFPGGGYQCLAIDLEGTEICDWLTSKGITAVLLKYRVPTLKFEGYRESQQALQDAQRTVRLARFHAEKWHVDPNRIGVIGFSAGGHLVAATSTRFDQRLYPPIDAADKVSCRPDFAIALYPGHLWHPDKKFELNPNIPVTGHTPPTFLLHAENDPVDNVNHTLVYYIALKNAGVPVELHLYAEGGHAFGLRRTELPITRWPDLVEIWLESIGVISDNTEVRRLIAALSSVEWREREQAVRSLSNMGLKSKNALAHLIKRLSDEEWQVRRAAAAALAHRGLASAQAIPSLITALADEEWQVRKPAAEALTILGPLSLPAVPALIKSLSDEEWQVRKRSAEALAAIGPSAADAVPALRNCLNDPEEQVRGAAALAIKKIADNPKK